MLSVAFFRNLNLGQQRSHSPTRPVLLDAFARAGAPAATNFQVNGTILFETDDDPQALAETVVRLLGPECGYADAVLARSADWLLALDPEVGPQAEFSFFDGPDPFPEDLPWREPRTGLTVVRADSAHAVSVTDAEQGGSATSALERLLGVPVTSRAVTTMARLQAKLRTVTDAPGSAG